MQKNGVERYIDCKKRRHKRYARIWESLKQLYMQILQGEVKKIKKLILYIRNVGLLVGSMK